MFQNKKLKQENEKLKKDNNEYRKIMTITRDLDLYKALIYVVKNYCCGKVEIPIDYFIQESEPKIEFTEDKFQHKFIFKVETLKERNK